MKKTITVNQYLVVGGNIHTNRSNVIADGYEIDEHGNLFCYDINDGVTTRHTVFAAGKWDTCTSATFTPEEKK